jgi:hypothetical protein
MDIDPIRRNIMMKKVAGFHSFDLTFFLNAALGELLRSGFGTRLSQNDV